MNDIQTVDIIEHPSPWSVERTLERLVDAIAKSGMTLFATIDHAANARSVGLEMPATTVLIYGNARGGTPIVLATPQAAIDLPLRVLVREGPGGKALIAFHPVAKMLPRFGVPESTAARLEPAQHMLVTALSS